MRINEVILTPLKIVPLVDGNVMHAMRRNDPGFHDFGEAYFSLIKPNAVKAWKRHRKMTLNLVVPAGLVSFAVVDETAGIGRRYQLGPDCYARLTVPPDFWVGFRGDAATSSIIFNLADLQHDPDEADRAGIERFAFDWNFPCWPGGGDQRISV
jgi:dTDP-4-dehydrorhamnose 3,5-epimerase